MVYTCCVPQCKTGYKSCRSKKNIAMFWFPSDQEICHLWVNAIPHKNLIITSSSRIYAKHFSQNDFDMIPIDKNKSRLQKRETQQLNRLRLKSNAIPHIFPGLPSYLSKQSNSKQSSCTFVGLTEQENPAKTVLTFMVQSVCSNYKDVVCLVPVEKLMQNYLIIILI